MNPKQKLNPPTYRAVKYRFPVFRTEHWSTCFTLYPVFALVSINITFSSLALCSPSSVVICLDEDANRSRKTERKNRQEELEMSATEKLFNGGPLHHPLQDLRTSQSLRHPGLPAKNETTSGKLPRERLDLWLLITDDQHRMKSVQYIWASFTASSREGRIPICCTWYKKQFPRSQQKGTPWGYREILERLQQQVQCNRKC